MTKKKTQPYTTKQLIKRQQPKAPTHQTGFHDLERFMDKKE
jgi:hypothetical protein